MGVASIYTLNTKNVYTCLLTGNTGRKEDCFVTNSYYACALHLFYTRVINFTRVYTRGIKPRMFFTFAHMAHTSVLFKLWVICTVGSFQHSAMFVKLA